MGDRYTVIAQGENVSLRDGVKSDIESYIRWWEEGEWQKYDAPWEVENEDVPEKKRRKLFKKLYMGEKEHPRKRAIISNIEKVPIGWVNRYQDRDDLEFWYIGIDICEDEYLEKGMGTQALRLWIDYLFKNSSIHKMALRTYSFNTRMQKVAEKLGFVEEGVEREVKEWKGEYIDLVDYGLLREEWKR